MMNYDEWDATEYVRDLTERNRMAASLEFHFCLGSGWDGLTEAISNMRNKKSFVVMDETAESDIRKVGGGYFETKAYTVFMLRRYKRMDEASRMEVLRQCRTLMQQYISKMIIDAEELKSALIYLDTDIQVREIGEVVLNGLTGLYFTFSFYRPIDLVMDADQWDDPYRTYGM